MKTRTEYVPYEKTVTVTEHRAPTDVSIQLWDEMRQKAIDSIVKQLPVEFSEVKGTILVMQMPSMADENIFGRKFAGKFVLNGQDHRFEGELDARDFADPVDVFGRRKDAETILKSFHAKLSEAIAAYMMRENQQFLKALLGL